MRQIHPMTKLIELATSRRSVLKGLGASGAALTLARVGASAQAQEPGVLRVGLSGRDMGTLHPAVATGGQDTAVIDAIFSGLVRYRPTEVSIEALEPDLAESWEVADDGKQYTFKLREGVQWQKGYGEVTSEDVKFSLEFVRDDPQSTFSTIFENIAAIDTPDPYTVVVSLTNPDPVFLTSVANWHGGYVISKKAVEELGDDYKNKPVGSGPFQFEEYRPKERVVLSANPDYYGGAPELSSIEFVYIPDLTARRFAFVNQEVDVIEGARNEDWLTEVVSATADDPQVDLLGPERNVVMSLKTSVEPLGDKRVRQAIAYAVDRGDYEAFFGRVFQPSYAPIPPSYFGALAKDEIPPELLYEHDLDRAKELLAEAGYPDGFALETVVSEREDYLALAQIGQEQLAKIGIDLQLNVLDHASWVAAIIKEAGGSIVWSSSARYPSARSHPREFWVCDADVTKPTGVQGFAEYCNPAFDALYKKANEAFDPAEQAKYYKEAQLILLEDMPSVPLGAMSTPVLRQGYVDLGYPVGGPILSLPYMYHFTAKTSV